MTLASGDEVRHISTRKPSQRPSEILIPSAKRLLQQYLPIAEVPAILKLILIETTAPIHTYSLLHRCNRPMCPAMVRNKSSSKWVKLR